MEKKNERWTEQSIRESEHIITYCVLEKTELRNQAKRLTTLQNTEVIL